MARRSTSRSFGSALVIEGLAIVLIVALMMMRQAPEGPMAKRDLHTAAEDNSPAHALDSLADSPEGPASETERVSSGVRFLSVRDSAGTSASPKWLEPQEWRYGPVER